MKSIVEMIHSDEDDADHDDDRRHIAIRVRRGGGDCSGAMVLRVMTTRRVAVVVVEMLVMVIGVGVAVMMTMMHVEK